MCEGKGLIYLGRESMPAVPDDLRRRSQKWDAKGRSAQEAFEWKMRNWQKYLGDNTVLETLPNPIHRGAVLAMFKLVHDPDTVLDARIASYPWGYAKAGFGPCRAERVMRQNTELENGRHFAVELNALARIAMTYGGGCCI
jgi:hypothetical protein